MVGCTENYNVYGGVLYDSLEGEKVFSPEWMP